MFDNSGLDVSFTIIMAIKLKLINTRCDGLQAYSQYLVVVIQIIVAGELSCNVPVHVATSMF